MKVKAAKILPRWLKTRIVVGPNQELTASHSPHEQDSNHGDIYIYIYSGHFSHIILTLVSQTARGQVSSPELSTLLLPWQSPRCSCSHACSVQAIKWQRFEAPLKKSSCEGNGFCRADNQAVPQTVPHPYSWLCKVNRDTKRIERKKKEAKAYPEKTLQKASDHFARQPL